MKISMVEIFVNLPQCADHSLECVKSEIRQHNYSKDFAIQTWESFTRFVFVFGLCDQVSDNDY